MLGWVITCHDERAQDMLLKLEAGLVRCHSVARLTTGAA